MCGRFYLIASAAELKKKFSLEHGLDLVPRYNIAPTQKIEDKPVFREAFAGRRCLVPANGFYEWQTRGARKQPYKIGLRNGALCAFAGLWEKWTPEVGDPVETFTIITTRANRLVSEVHERMPVIIAPADYQRWLSAPDATAKRLLVPYTGAMTIAPVSDRINSSKDDDVGLIAPVQM